MVVSLRHPMIMLGWFGSSSYLCDVGHSRAGIVTCWTKVNRVSAKAAPKTNGVVRWKDSGARLTFYHRRLDICG